MQVLVDFQKVFPGSHLSPEMLESCLSREMMSENQRLPVATLVRTISDVLLPSADNVDAPSPFFSGISVVLAETPRVKSEPDHATSAATVTASASPSTIPAAPVLVLASPIGVPALQSDVATRIRSISPARAVESLSQLTRLQQKQRSRKRYRHAKEEPAELQELKKRKLVLKNLKLELELGLTTHEEAIERERRGVASHKSELIECRRAWQNGWYVDCLSVQDLCGVCEREMSRIINIV